jgi:hypothetical protein
MTWSRRRRRVACAAEWSLDAHGRIDAMGDLTDGRDTSFHHYTTSPPVIEASKSSSSFWSLGSLHGQLMSLPLGGVPSDDHVSTSPIMPSQK